MLLSICLLVAIASGILYLLSPWLNARQLAKVDSRLSLIPIDLPSKAEASLSNTITDCYGFSIRLPAREILKTIRNNSSTVFLLRAGEMLEVFDPSRGIPILRTSYRDEHAAKVTGLEAFPSRFELAKAAMGTSPDQAKWWKLHTMANRKVEYLLVNKLLMMTHPVSTNPFTLGPIYSISAGAFHGFQIGNPDASPYEVHLDLFDQADRYFTFDVTGPQKHEQILTQAEINAIVASIKPIP